MIECIKFNEYKSGMLQGFANFYIDKWGVELNGCSVFEKEGRNWIKLPAKEYIDAQGEKKFAEIIWFRDKDLKKVFDEKLAEAFSKFKDVESIKDVGNVDLFNDSAPTPF